MSDENQAQADAPDATNQSVVDPLDTTISQDGTKIALNNYQAELDKALNAELEPDDAQGDEPAEEIEQVEEQPEEEEQEQISKEEEEPEAAAEEEEPRLQERFRFKDDEDKAVAALAKAKGISLVEAAQQYAALSTPKEQPQEQQISAEAPETVKSVTAKIKELEAQAKASATALNFDEAEDFRAQANDLRDKLIDLKLSERDAEKQAEARKAQEFYAKFEASENKALQFYPDAGKADSPLAKEMAALDAQMQELGDPLYYSEDKPFILAKQAAVRLGIPMTKPGEKPAAKPSVQRRPMQPASGNARTTTTDAAKSVSEAIDGVKTVDEYEKLVAQFAR